MPIIWVGSHTPSSSVSLQSRLYYLAKQFHCKYRSTWWRTTAGNSRLPIKAISIICEKHIALYGANEYHSTMAKHTFLQNVDRFVKVPSVISRFSEGRPLTSLRHLQSGEPHGPARGHRVPALHHQEPRKQIGKSQNNFKFSKGRMIITNHVCLDFSQRPSRPHVTWIYSIMPCNDIWQVQIRL